jgi:hypothetical protein
VSRRGGGTVLGSSRKMLVPQADHRRSSQSVGPGTSHSWVRSSAVGSVRLKHRSRSSAPSPPRFLPSIPACAARRTLSSRATPLSAASTPRTPSRTSGKPHLARCRVARAMEACPSLGCLLHALMESASKACCLQTVACNALG